MIPGLPFHVKWWLLILSCTPPPHWQNVNLDRIDKIVDHWLSIPSPLPTPPLRLTKCESGEDWQNYWSFVINPVSPSPMVNTKTALAKWSRFLAPCPTLYSLVSISKFSNAYWTFKCFSKWTFSEEAYQSNDKWQIASISNRLSGNCYQFVADGVRLFVEWTHSVSSKRSAERLQKFSVKMACKEPSV